MRIFISYSRKDAVDIAESLRDSLMHNGHQVFTDVKDIQEGDIWSNVIEENIKSCDIFIILLTYFSLKSPDVEKEVVLAKKEDKRIIPCIYKGIDLKDIKWSLQEIQGPIFEDKFDLIRKIRIPSVVDKDKREVPKSIGFFDYYKVKVKSDYEYKDSLECIPKDIEFLIPEFEINNVGESYINQRYRRWKKEKKMSESGDDIVDDKGDDIVDDKGDDIVDIIKRLLRHYHVVTIVGEYGCGKTATSFKILYDLINEEKDFNPIYLSIRYFRNDLSNDVLNMDNLIIKILMNKYKLNFNECDVQQFKDYLKEGKFTFILDGLEDIGESDGIYKFIDKVIEIIVSSKNRVIFTSKINTLDKKIKNLLLHYPVIEIMDFGEKEISKFIDKNAKKKAAEINKLIGMMNLNDLIKKPLVINAICDNIDKFKEIAKEEGIKIGIQNIFEVIINSSIEHGFNRNLGNNTNYSTVEKQQYISMIRKVSEDVAVNQYLGENKPIQKIANNYFEAYLKYPKSEDSLENLLYFIDSQIFLFVDNNRVCWFTNNQLIEYFVAKRILVSILKKSTDEFFKITKIPLSEEILNHISHILKDLNILKLDDHYFENQSRNCNLQDEIIKELNNLIENPQNVSKGAAISILAMIDKDNLRILERISCFGQRLNLTNSNLRSLNFSHLRLHCDFSNSKMEGIKFRKSILTGSLFNNSQLKNSDLSKTNLENCNFANADLTGSNLSGANLSHSFLEGSNLTRADLTGTILTKCNFAGADLSHVSLCSCIFKSDGMIKEDLSSPIIFKDAYFFHTDFEGIEIEADFNEAFFWQCDLGFANFGSSDFSNTVFQFVRFNNTKFKPNQSSNPFFHYSPIIYEFKEIINNNHNNSCVELEEQEYEHFKNFCKTLCGPSNHHVRHVRIVNKNRVVLYQNTNTSLLPLVLDNRDKFILIHHLLSNWSSLTLYQKIRNDSDNIVSTIIIYDKINIISIPRELDEVLLIVTTQNNSNYNDVIKWCIENGAISSNKEFKEPLIRTRAMPNEEISELYCKSIDDLIQKLSSLSGVRRVEYHIENKILSSNKGIDKNQEINQRNLRDNISRRWNIRKKFEDKLGKARFSITKYKNKKTISSMIGENFLIVESDPNADNDEEIMKLIDNYKTLRTRGMIKTLHN